MGETTFIHITDLHIGNPGIVDDHLFSDTSTTLTTVLEMIGTMDARPSFIIASGDLTNRGDVESYAHLRAIMAATDLPVIYAIGNHDTRAGFYQVMLDRSTELDAPYDHAQVLAGVHIITLDTTTPGEIGGNLTPDQFAWLASELEKNSELPKLIVAHHAPALGDAPPWDHWRTIEFGRSQELARLLRGKNVLGILCGHIHHDRFSVWHGIPVVVGMGQHVATDILTTDILRMVEGASFGIGTIRASGLTMALVPLAQSRRELNRYDLSLLRHKQDAAMINATR